MKPYLKQVYKYHEFQFFLILFQQHNVIFIVTIILPLLEND